MSQSSLKGMRKWLAFGTGAGIEIDGSVLRAAVVRVRPSGLQALAAHTIENFRDKPAAEWGAELIAFFTQAGASGRAVTVVLPPQEAISRTIALPGVPKKELASALAFETEAWTPYGVGETASSWTPVGESSALAGISRAETITHYSELFVEAGIPVAGFVTAPAAIYSALRFTPEDRGEFLALDVREGETRLYGESAAAAVFWAAMEIPTERAIALTRAQMRLTTEAEPHELTALLPGGSIAGAAATISACPWLSGKLNLLPPERRTSRSPWMFAPTMALLALTLVAGVALAGFRQYEDRRLLADLNAEIAKVQPVARRAADAEKARIAAAARIEQLKNFRDRTRKDLDALKEVTRLLVPPAWSTQLDLTRIQTAVAGESNAAAELPKAFDASTLFKNTEFTAPLNRSQTPGMDIFRLRAEREGVTR